jgi:hypothetical protein
MIKAFKISEAPLFFFFPQVIFYMDFQQTSAISFGAYSTCTMLVTNHRAGLNINLMEVTFENIQNTSEIFLQIICRKFLVNKINRKLLVINDENSCIILNCQRW